MPNGRVSLSADLHVRRGPRSHTSRDTITVRLIGAVYTLQLNRDRSAISRSVHGLSGFWVRDAARVCEVDEDMRGELGSSVPYAVDACQMP